MDQYFYLNILLLKIKLRYKYFNIIYLFNYNPSIVESRYVPRKFTYNTSLFIFFMCMYRDILITWWMSKVITWIWFFPHALEFNCSHWATINWHHDLLPVSYLMCLLNIILYNSTDLSKILKINNNWLSEVLLKILYKFC